VVVVNENETGTSTLLYGGGILCASIMRVGADLWKHHTQFMQ